VNIGEALEATPILSLDLDRYVKVSADESTGYAVRAMREVGQACACVVEAEKLVGVFTERDVLQRVIGREGSCSRPIRDAMTTTVRTIRSTDSAADGLAVMADWWVRNVPVLGGDGELVGNLSYYAIMETIANVVAARLGDTTADRAIHQSLALVDFTGINTSNPVTVGMKDTVDVAAHHMQVRSIGSVLVVDDREQLVGVFTEYDLMMLYGCERVDLSTIAMENAMTPDPVALSARSSIAEGIREMALRGFSHVPLTGESNRPVGVASFRDVAAYLELGLETLG